MHKSKSSNNDFNDLYQPSNKPGNSKNYDLAIGQKDLSITSENSEGLDIDFCQGQLFKYNPTTPYLDKDLYPQIFSQYPAQLIKALNQFIKPFIKHDVAKLLNYEINMAFLIAQISYKLGKIKRYFEDNKHLQTQFKLFQFYLLFHSLGNTSQLFDMIKILLGKKQISYNWPLKRKNEFIDLKTNYSILIDQDNGMKVMKKIDYFHLAVAQRCSRLKYYENYIPFDLNKVYLKLFDNNQTKSLMIRINLIAQKIQFDQVRKHFQDKQLQDHINSCTQLYFKSLYKQVYIFAEKNQQDRTLIELIYLILIAKLNSQDLPFWILNYIENEKMKILNSSKIVKADNFSSFIVESNIYFRAELPRIYLLMKKNGFMKLTSFLHENQLIDIMKEISWLSNYFYQKSIKSKINSN